MTGRTVPKTRIQTQKSALREKYDAGSITPRWLTILVACAAKMACTVGWGLGIKSHNSLYSVLNQDLESGVQMRVRSQI